MYSKHKFFGLIFNAFSRLSIDENQVTFIINDEKSFKGNFESIKEELSKRGQFSYFYFNKNKPTVSSLKKLAKSRYVFLNDNFLAMAFMNFNSRTTVTQLWHAPGAFKKFGASSSDSPEEIEMISKSNSKVDHLIISSQNISPHYENAFRIDKSKIKALGTPRTDYYFRNHDISRLREDFIRKYPQAKNRKLILYAPTFRETEEFNNVFDFLDLKKFNESLGNEYVLALRLHPKIRKFFPNDIESEDNFIDLTDYEDERELLLISDILITDYSSIMMEFALLNKPVLFFTPDLDSYMKNERGFYFDFKKVPGKIAYSDDELIESISDGDFEMEKIPKFLKTQFDHFDGKTSERIVDYILNNEG